MFYDQNSLNNFYNRKKKKDLRLNLAKKPCFYVNNKNATSFSQAFHILGFRHRILLFPQARRALACQCMAAKV